MGTKTGIYKQKCSISWFLFIFEGKSARKMKMTGYYQFSQALSVAMPESSSAITISGVEPAKKYLFTTANNNTIILCTGLVASERCTGARPDLSD
jgi:hypothetical protein